jgi:DNA-binding transcriptional LysR family regulator
MPLLGSPTLDQLRVFLAVVEAGSFSAAARRLNRQQSVISYAIANLEAQLGGMLLFERQSHRPTLTAAGAAILADARQLAWGMDNLQARARGLLSGLEGEVAVAVDVMLPTSRLVAVLAAFREAFPTVTLRLYVEALGSVARLVLDSVCSVGVSGPLLIDSDKLEQRPIGTVTMIAVAAPDHPLARRGGMIPRSAVRTEVQLVLTDRSDLTRGRDFAVLSTQTWRLADLGAKHALLLQGLGWGNMPEAMVRADVAAGRLVVLDLADRPPNRYVLSSVRRSDQPPGPAACWLLERLAGASPEEDLGASA